MVPVFPAKVLSVVLNIHMLLHHSSSPPMSTIFLLEKLIEILYITVCFCWLNEIKINLGTWNWNSFKKYCKAGKWRHCMQLRWGEIFFEGEGLRNIGIGIGIGIKIGISVGINISINIGMGSLQKKKTEIYWSFTNTGGGVPPDQYISSFFLKKTFVA